MVKLNSTKLSSKNQITIPKRIVEQLGLTPGDRLLLDVHEDEIVLKVPPRIRNPTEWLYGSLRRKIDAVKAVREFRKTGG